MPHAPVSARGVKPVPSIQLDGGLFDPPVARPRGRHETPKEFETPIKHGPERDRSGRQSREHECVRTVQRLNVEAPERRWNPHFAGKSKAAPKDQASVDVKQLPLLAKKVLQACDHGAPHDGIPLTALLNSPAKEGDFALGEEVEVRDHDMKDWRLGVVTSTRPLKVRLHEWDEAFQWHSVRAAKKVQTQCACGFIFVDGGLFCSACGKERVSNTAPTVRIPCSKPPRPPGPPPSAPKAPHRKRSQTPQRSASEESSEATHSMSARGPGENLRQASAERDLNPRRSPSPRARARSLEVHGKWEQNTVPILGANGEVFRARPAQSGRPQWEQHTVPILAEDGKIVALRPDGRSRSHEQNHWEENTVPIRGQNGEVIALRPSGERYEMPAWNRHASSTAGEAHSMRRDFATTPSSTTSEITMWAGTSQGGFALDTGSMKPLGTSLLPIPSDIGTSVSSVCTSCRGAKPDMAHGSKSHLLSSGQNSARSSPFASFRRLGTSMLPIPSDVGTSTSNSSARMSDTSATSTRTDEPGQSELTIPIVAVAPASLELPGPECSLQSDTSSCRPLGTSMLPIPSDVGSSAPSQCGSLVAAELSSVSDASSFKRLGTSMLPIPSDIGSALSTASAEPVPVETASRTVPSTTNCGAWSEHTAPPRNRIGEVTLEKPLNVPRGIVRDGDTDSALYLETVSDATITPRNICSSDALASPASPVAGDSSPASPKLVQSASVDSLSSVNEIIRLANRARQDTPDVFTLQCLQDVLKAECGPGTSGNTTGTLFPQAPEAEELVMRLKQLPELWRTTILQMLEQVEAVQKTVETMDDDEHQRLAQRRRA